MLVNRLTSIDTFICTSIRLRSVGPKLRAELENDRRNRTKDTKSQRTRRFTLTIIMKVNILTTLLRDSIKNPTRHRINLYDISLITKKFFYNKSVLHVYFNSNFYCVINVLI